MKPRRKKPPATRMSPTRAPAPPRRRRSAASRSSRAAPARRRRSARWSNRRRPTSAGRRRRRQSRPRRRTARGSRSPARMPASRAVAICSGMAIAASVRPAITSGPRSREAPAGEGAKQRPGAARRGGGLFAHRWRSHAPAPGDIQANPRRPVNAACAFAGAGDAIGSRSARQGSLVSMFTRRLAVAIGLLSAPRRRARPGVLPAISPTARRRARRADADRRHVRRRRRAASMTPGRGDRPPRGQPRPAGARRGDRRRHRPPATPAAHL